MTCVAVIAHRHKTIGGGLPELRTRLADAGHPDPLWSEVSTFDEATAAARTALERGADLVLVWGGDGTVQRVVDTVAGSGACVAIIPAGTANLLAGNLGIPCELPAALDVALNGTRRPIDIGVVNGERFAVMAGAGFDAAMLRDADGRLKDRLGRLAYVWTGVKATRRPARPTTITIDGERWFDGRATCVLLGSQGTLTGGLVAFPDASASDGILEVGVVTAEGRWQWARVMARLILRSGDRSPLTELGRGRDITITFGRPTLYELDGDPRDRVERIEAGVEPAALIVAVPDEAAA